MPDLDDITVWSVRFHFLAGCVIVTETAQGVNVGNRLNRSISE